MADFHGEWCHLCNQRHDIGNPCSPERAASAERPSPPEPSDVDIFMFLTRLLPHISDDFWRCETRQLADQIRAGAARPGAAEALTRAEAAYRAVIALPGTLGPEVCALVESQYELAGLVAGLR